MVGCRSQGELASPPRTAATNSYLEYVLRDLLGRDEPVLRLAEAGMCPGHFDFRPSQVAQLGQCRLLLRFDFQAPLGRKIQGLCPSLPIEPIRVEAGLCEPKTYLSACRQSADILVRSGLLTAGSARVRLEQVTSRVNQAAAEATARFERAGLAGTSILTSMHQSAFCRWLGLKVVGTFREADSAGVEELDQAVQAGRTGGVRLVVANRPEGRRAADALAKSLGAQVVVLGNFPDPQEGHVLFDDLLRTNVDLLIQAGRPDRAGGP